MTEGEKVEEYSYKRENGEPVKNLQATKSCKNEQNRDIIDNDRLGSYDKFGNYIMTPEIVSELIYMPKLMIAESEEEDKKVYNLRSYIPIFGDLYFKIVVKKREIDLLLIETVNRELGAYVEVYEELVDAINLEEGEVIPIEVVFKNYNVFTGEEEQIFVSPYDFMHILTRKVYMALLSKELNEIIQFDEKEAFDEMIENLKQSGEYGERVIKEFTTRLKDRTEIFEIKNTNKYHKAINEVLLSAVDIVTTEKDKENPKIHETYMKVINARNKNIDVYLKKSHERVDEQYVVNLVQKTSQKFREKIVNKEFSKENNKMQDKIILEFYEKLTPKKQEEIIKKQEVQKKLVMPVAPILKTGKKKEVQPLTKEEKIAQILNKEKPVEEKKEEKEEEKPKKVVPAKAQKHDAQAKKSKGGASKAKSGGSKSKGGASKSKGSSGKSKGGAGKSKGSSPKKVKGGSGKSSGSSSGGKVVKPKISFLTVKPVKNFATLPSLALNLHTTFVASKAVAKKVIKPKSIVENLRQQESKVTNETRNQNIKEEKQDRESHKLSELELIGEGLINSDAEKNEGKVDLQGVIKADSIKINEPIEQGKNDIEKAQQIGSGKGTIEFNVTGTEKESVKNGAKIELTSVSEAEATTENINTLGQKQGQTKNSLNIENINLETKIEAKNAQNHTNTGVTITNSEQDRDLEVTNKEQNIEKSREF